MSRSKNRTVADSLKLLAQEFTAEMNSRKWGKGEFRKLVAQSKNAGEPFSEHEANAVRWTLAALDRVTSIHVGAGACLEIIGDLAPTRVISAGAFRAAIFALRKQANFVLFDIGAAVHSATKLDLPKLLPPPRPPARRFARWVSPEMRRNIKAQLSRPMSAVERALRETVMACHSFALGLSEPLHEIRAEVRRHRRLRVQVASELALFVLLTALAMRMMLTEKVPAAIEATRGARGRQGRRATRAGTTRKRRS